MVWIPSAVPNQLLNVSEKDLEIFLIYRTERIFTSLCFGVRQKPALPNGFYCAPSSR